MADRERLDFWHGSQVLAFHEPTIFVGPHSEEVWLIQHRFLWPAPACFQTHQHVAQLSRSCPSGSCRLQAIEVCSISIHDFLIASRALLCNALHLGVWKVFVASCAPDVIHLTRDFRYDDEELTYALTLALLTPVSTVLEYLGVQHACEAWPPYTVTRLP